MKNSTFITLASILICGCGNRDDSNNIVQKDTIEQISPQSNQSKSVEKSIKGSNEIIPDFLVIAENVTDYAKIHLQGVENSDSSGPYIVKEFISDTLSFDLLFYPKDGKKDAVNFEVINKAKANNFKNFICFSFVFPMENPDSMKDYHDDNVKYPVIVKSFVKETNDWAFYSQLKVQNRQELSQFEIKSIYSKVPE